MAGGQLEVLSGAAVRINDLAVGVDKNAGRRIGFYQELLGDF
jgi:hypothetical protein